MNSLDTTPISEADLPALASLFTEVFTADPWNQPWTHSSAMERLNILYQSYGFYGYQILSGDKPVAGLFASLGSFLGELELEIVEMFVSSEFQRAGLGSKLLEAIKT